MSMRPMREVMVQLLATVMIPLTVAGTGLYYTRWQQNLSDLKTMIDLHLRLVLEERNLEVTGLLHECKTLSTGDRTRINRRKKEYVRMATNLIADVATKYNVKDLNPKLAAFALLGMLNWTYQWYSASGSNSREEIVKSFQQIFLSGILGHAWAEQYAARAGAH